MLQDENYFDHDADIGIIGRGTTLEACFIEGAEATFSLMGNLSRVQPQKTIFIEFEESDIELAFVTWLNLLIGKSQVENILLSTFKIRKQDSVWQGEAQGETWQKNMERGIDVKGATLTMLSVKKIDHLWEAKCVLDV